MSKFASRTRSKLKVEKIRFFPGYEMAAMQTQILQDTGFEGLSNGLSVAMNNRGQQMNGLPHSHNNSVINIQSPNGFIHEKSPTPRVINLTSTNMQQSQSDAHNPRSG
jgi:hypothetical protein